MARSLETAAAWLLALLWILPLAYALWAAFHPAEFSARFVLTAPLTFENFATAWNAAPFARYLVNTVLLVSLILAAQLVLCTLAAYAFARYEFPGRDIAFALVLVQLMVMPDVLIVENYRTMSRLGILDSTLAIALPYMASAFGVFLMRQTFKQIPKELDDAARVEGASALQVLWKVYVPLAVPTYIAYGLVVSISYHWNNFLWPIIVTNTVNARPLTVGLQVFASTDQGIDWSIICAATLMTSAPLLVAFLLFQRQFVQSFMRAGDPLMRVLQWNIQWCRGMDGRVDPARIARDALAMNPDVCCFQEVAINYPDLGAPGDQPALLARHLPGYSLHFAPVVDADGQGGRRQFGNLLASRLPVRQVFRHSLPWPPHAGVPNMPRVAIEAVIEAPWGLVSVFTTHLEYYSDSQRAAQVARLCELKAEAAAHSVAPAGDKPRDAGPFAPFARPAASILTADFNMRPGDPLVAKLLGHWQDAWSLANPGQAQPPTFGVFDRAFASEPYACDLVLVSRELAGRVVAAKVDGANRSSDHQPVIVDFR